MAHKTTYTVPHRRKREGRTNYRKRLSLLKSRKPRLIVRKSLRHIMLQIIEYTPTGDKVVLQANSKELSPMGWTVSNGNIPEAYLTGLLLAKKAKTAKFSGEVIVDIGLSPSVHGSRLYAAIKGAVDGELTVLCGDDIAPPEDRLKGMHIVAYAKSLVEDKEKYNKIFSRYLKANIDPTRLNELVENVKANIVK
jgi:large subunit ribosomal protein L18